MVEYKELNFDNLDCSLIKAKNIIYGAGLNGSVIKDKLEQCGVNIYAYYDDDKTRWGGGNTEE